jgi:hypothetical protein
MNSPNTTIKQNLKNSTSSSRGAWHRRDHQEDAPRLMKKSKSKKEKTRFGARFRNTT